MFSHPNLHFEHVQLCNGSLRLPRILCFHGGGTNARIFKLQLRPITRALHQHFRFVFVEAPFTAQPGPDVLSVYKDFGPFKSWFRIRPDDPTMPARTIVRCVSASIQQAMDLDDEQGATGEWAGVLGFSQGAKLAASLLYTQQTGYGQMHFRFGLLFAGRGPLVHFNPMTPVPQGLVSAALHTMSSHRPKEAMGSVLEMACLHIHGLKDPGLELHRLLADECCHKMTTVVVEWNGEHRMPFREQDVREIVAHILEMAKSAGVQYGEYS